jgi:dTDP-glucose 4,6-dehydratase
MTMKILVTGGLGFIGSNFIRYLLSNHANYEVINVDKMGIGSNPASLHDLENNPNYRFIKGDICNPQLLHKVITQVNAMVNIAAETHVDRSISDPYAFLENNTVGTYMVLEAVRKHNPRARMVQVSTDEVLAALTRVPSPKKTLLFPLTPIPLLKQRRTCSFWRTKKPSS